MSGSFRLRDVRFQYEGADRPALTEVSLDLEPGVLHAVLGPNGSGKSTLLRVMLGELEAASGRVEYEGREIAAWRRREIAREVAFVPQAEPLAFPMTVRALVEMGRYPHVGALGRRTAADDEAVERAMQRAGVLELSARAITTLSGGERQRARIARALAQEPATLVLDEPTASLDLHFEMETFELMRELAEERAFTVVVATHNLNLAARYAAHLILMSGGRVQAAGSPREVIRAEVIEQVYRWPVIVTTEPDLGDQASAPQVVPLPRSRAGTGG
jgi:iron complex transport system ATP-binding protein